MSRKPKKIVAWIKPYCPWCQGLLEMLKDHGLEAEIRDVIAHAHHRDEMVRLTSQSKAPCVEIDGELLVDTSDAEVHEWMAGKGYIEAHPA